MKHLKAIIMSLLLVLLVAIPAFAQHPKHHGEVCCASDSMPKLTTEQEKQFADLKMKLIKETEPIKTELKIKQMELQVLWKEDNPDAKKILAKTKEIIALMTSLQEKLINHRVAVYKILTPEQRKMMRDQMGMYCIDCCGMGEGCHKMYSMGAGNGCHRADGKGTGCCW